MNYQDYRQSLKQKLSDKVHQEISSFREGMLGKPPQEIFDAHYQIDIKNDITEYIFNTNYSIQVAKALLKSPNLLYEIYDG